MRYSQVERALADALAIAPGAMGAFRARLQHLRNLGVPAVERPGYGRAVEYRRTHVIQMLVALELVQMPRIAAPFALDIVRRCGVYPADGTYIAIIGQQGTFEPACMVLTSLPSLLDWLNTASPRAFTILDLSASIAALDAQLEFRG